MDVLTKAAQVRVDHVSPAYRRVTFDNPPLNVMGAAFVLQLRDILEALESDEHVKVLVFDSAVDGYFLNHLDFLAKLHDLTAIPQGPTGLEAWPDILVRLTRAPFVSIASIRGRATGNGSEIALACDMSFASREKSIFSQWRSAWASSPVAAPWRDYRGSSVGGALWRCFWARTMFGATWPRSDGM